MKPFAFAILMAIFIEYLLFLVATYLNIIHLDHADFKKIRQTYTFTEFQKACLYTKSKSKYELIAVVLCIVAFMTFWMYYGFTLLEIIAEAVSSNSIIRGVVYWTLLLILCGIFKMIFDSYEVFVIEERYHFNTRSVKTFIKDNFFEMFSAFCIFIPALIIFMSIYMYWGPSSWWICLIVFGIVIFLSETKLPKIMIREYYHSSKIPEGDLKNKITNYCKRIDISVDNIYIVDASRRTKRVSAAFYGIGKSKVIMLSDNLIKNCTDEEILCVIGHEAGHSKMNHVLKTSILNLAIFGVFMYFFDYFTEDIALFQAFFIYSRAYYTGICFYSLLCIIPGIVILPLYRAYYRKLQQEADIFSLNTVNDKESLISVMKKLSKTNLVNPLPHPFYITLFNSQYAVEHRIGVIEKMSSAKMKE